MKILSKGKGFALVFLTALCWGPNFLFIKVAVSEIPPLTLVLLRVGIGAAVLFLISLSQKIYIWRYRHLWKNFVWMGITMNIVPFFFINIGELYISSSLAGVLNSLGIIFIAVIAHYFGPHDPLTKKRIAGIVSGILGLIIIYLPGILHENVGRALGILMMLVACLSYGVGATYVKTHLVKASPLTMITGQMITSTILLLPFALIIDRPFNLPHLSTDVIFSTFALGGIGSGIGLLFYYKAIQMTGATFATLAVLLVAIFAILLGGIFLHEQITWNLYLGAFFILTGLLSVNPVIDEALK